MKKSLLILGIFLSTLLLSGSNGCEDPSRCSETDTFDIVGTQRIDVNGYYAYIFLVRVKDSNKRFLVVRTGSGIAVCAEQN